MELPPKTPYWSKEIKWREDVGENVSNYWMIWMKRKWELQDQAHDLSLRRAGFARGQRPVVRLHDDETCRWRGGIVQLYSAALSRTGKDSLIHRNMRVIIPRFRSGTWVRTVQQLEATSPCTGVLQFVNVCRNSKRWVNKLRNEENTKKSPVKTLQANGIVNWDLTLCK